MTRRSAIYDTAALGPAQRRFANAACIVDSEYDPQNLLAGLKRLERDFGRRSGQRWGDRVLDCDIILWSGGTFSAPELSIPHPEFHRRQFVLEPACAIAPQWRDPLTGFSLRHLLHRLR